MRRLPLLLCLLALAGCGEQDADRLRADVEQRAQEVRDRAREVRARAQRLRDRVADRVREVLEELEKAVPTAGPGTRPPSAGRRTAPSEIESFLTELIEDVDRYWTRTLAAAGLPEPRVSYHWVAPGDRRMTACRVVADDQAAFYCPADDTIYLAQRLASAIHRGVARGFPGEQAGFGRAAGDFGVAYVVAHEYAHNLQAELGRLSADARASSKPFELQADCMAGLWANSVYRAGRLKEGDVEEAIATALAVGDFDFGNPNHHGTPQERRDAWVTGFESGEPADCRRFA